MSQVNLDFLYGLKREGIKLELSIMRQLSQQMGNPQDSFQSFHITGTNGKGSTSAFIFNVLRKLGTSGLYTSPHLVKFNERIAVDTHLIEDAYIEKFMDENRRLIESLMQKERNPTFFEATTILAFQYFRDQKVKVASVEVGLGGRLDSTNIVTPVVSVITSVGYEHADKLGCSLEAIAYEKAGIIKKSRPVILGDTKPQVVRMVKRIADVNESRFIQLDNAVKFSNLEFSLEGSKFSIGTEHDTYDLETRLIGDFQARNAAMAVLALENSGLNGISRKVIEDGIRNTVWPGRMEIISREPLVMVDSAHNPPAANALGHNISKVLREQPVLIIGMMKDKDIYSYLAAIRRISGSVIFTTPDEPMRAADPCMLNRTYGPMFNESLCISDPVEALEYAVSKYSSILVTGSMYLVGVIKKIYTPQQSLLNNENINSNKFSSIITNV